MSTDSNAQEVPELLTHLLTQFQAEDIGEAGKDPTPAPLDELYALFKTKEEKEAACAGVQAFVNFGRQYLRDHPVSQHFMLSQGLGVVLGGGIEVALGEAAFQQGTGEVDDAGAVAVTQPQSIRGQHGIEPGTSQPVTGTQPDRTVRRPA